MKKQQNGFLLPPHLLTNFEIQKYYQNEPRFNGVYSRDNLPKIKDGAYVVNLDEHSDVGTHWVALYVSKASPKDVNNNNVTYFDFFGVEHISKEIKTFFKNKNRETNIFRIMCGYFCIGFIYFMLAGKKSTDYTNLFSPYGFNKNDNTILSYFKYELNYQNKPVTTDKISPK